MITHCSYQYILVVKRNLKYILSISILFAFISQAYSIKAADLLEIYKLALENDSTFQAASYQYEASPEIFRQARAELLPTLTADGTYKRTEQRIEDTDVAVYGVGLARYPSKGYILTLNQPVFRYSSIMRLLQSSAEVRQAALEFESEKQDLIFRVSEAYMDVLEARDRLEFTIAEEEALKLHYELAKERYSNGLAPITDFYDAKARLTFTMAQRSLAENALNDALEALTVITDQKIVHIAGLPMPALSLDDALDSMEELPDNSSAGESVSEGLPLKVPDPDDVDQWLEAAREHNIGILIKKQEVLVAKREIDRQKGGHIPNVSLVGRITRDDEGGSLFGGHSDIITREAIVQLNVPLFQGFAVQSRVTEARKLYQAAGQELEKEIRTTGRVVQSSFLGVKGAIESTAALRQSVISSRIALEGKQEGFKAGLLPSLAVLDAVRDLHRARQEYAKAQYDYILNSLELKRAVGNLTEEDIMEINQWLNES